jgi:hypothetical protein
MWTWGSTSWPTERIPVRRITDRQGHTWDVIVGRESFGALFALFVPTRGNPEGARQTILGAQSQMDAEAELAALSTAELGRLLDRSEPKMSQ